MSGQALDLTTAFRAIRRRRRALVAAVLVGAAAGAAAGAVASPGASATALVLLPSVTNPSAAAPMPDPATQVAIAMSVPDLRAAGRAQRPPLTTTAVRHRVHVGTQGTNLLSFTASGRTAADAERLANALAHVYIQTVNQAGLGATTTEVSGLTAEAAQLTVQEHDIQKQMRTVSSRLPSENATSRALDERLLASLQGDENAAALQLDAVNNEIETARIGNLLASGTVVVVQPAAPSQSPANWIPIRAGIGAGLGLLLGLIVVLTRAHRDRGVLQRDQISAAVSAPVLASLRSDGCRSLEDWNRILDGYEPSTPDAWGLRRVLQRREVSDGPTKVSIVAFENDGPAVSVGTRLARYASSLGTATVLVPSDNEAEALLRAACRSEGHQSRPDRLHFSGDPGAGEADLRVFDVLVPRLAPKLAPPADSKVVLAVTAGSATPEDLARVALAADDAGTRITGVIVVNPDPLDATTGSLAAGQHFRRSPTSAARTRPMHAGRTWVPAGKRV